MAGYVAAKLCGLEAESHEEAWDRAEHEDGLPWEIAACVPQVTAHKAVEAIVDATSNGHTLAETTRSRGWKSRPVFGKLSLVALPMMAYGYLTDTSAVGAVLSACTALGGF